MTTRYRRTMRKRLQTAYDDWQWWWSRNGVAMVEGFALGLLGGIIVVELYLGV